MIKLRDALQGMSMKEKIDYIWEYYKLPILGVLFFCIFAFLLIDGISSKGEEPVGFMVVSEADLATIEQLDQQINQHFSDLDVLFEHIQHRGGLIEDNALELMERLATRIGVGQVDILVTHVPFAEQLLSEDIFQPLGEMIDLEQLNSLAHELYEVDGVVYGIRTSELRIFSQYDVYQDTFLFVPASGRKNDEAKILIEDLLSR